jgi:hypothetical protein
MHQRLRPRIKKRSAIVLALASAAALALGGIASAITDNQSSLSFKFSPNTVPTSTFQNGSLFVHTHTVYANPGTPGGFVQQLVLFFDSDFKFTPGTIPKCTATFDGFTTIMQAWNTCGPGAGAAHNAYLSPATGVSGKGLVTSSDGRNFNGCVLAFNGPLNGGNPTITLLLRLTLVNGQPADCSSPASNTSGGSSSILKGTLTPAAAPFGKKLTVPNVRNATVGPLVDLTTTLKRGNYVSAKCSHNPKIWKMRGVFTYTSGGGQPADAVNATQACT